MDNQNRILIVGIDDSKDVLKQLIEIAAANKLPEGKVIAAWNERQQTLTSDQQTLPNLCFDIRKMKIEETSELKSDGNDYYSVKERNKFFERRRK
jgi:hypothetical protein